MAGAVYDSTINIVLVIIIIIIITRDPVNLKLPDINPYICMLRLCTTHYTPVSGATIIEQFLFIDICTFALICLIPGFDGPMGLRV